MKYYYYSWVYRSYVDGEISGYNLSVDKHPYEKMREGIEYIDGHPEHRQTPYHITFWEEISEEHYKLLTGNL